MLAVHLLKPLSALLLVWPNHALPHIFPQEFNTQQKAERWLEGSECQGLVQKVLARQVLSEAHGVHYQNDPTQSKSDKP